MIMFDKKIAPLATGLLTFSCLSLAQTPHAEDTMVVSATNAPASLEQEPPAAEKQATLGNLGKRELIDVPWNVQTLSSPVIEQQ